MRVFPCVALLSASIVSQACAQANGLAGEWKGTWTRNGDPLPVTVRFAKLNDAYSGSFDSDALQVVGIPFSDVRNTNGRAHFQLKGDQSVTVFDGAITGESMSGTFTDGSGTGTFELRRAALPAASIRTREMTFRGKDVTLAGTLLSPALPRKHPAILFLHGSGPEGRWANHYLAQKFAEGGVVALIYDKRGVGQSTGNWQKAGFEALAGDAVAGIRFLQSQPEVDPTRVGVYGHSQGGTMAPLVGVRAGDLGFIIASAAGGIDPAKVEIYSVENSIGVTRLSLAERADAQRYVRELIDVAYGGNDRASLDAMATVFKSRGWYFDPPPPGNSYWLISKQIASFKPADYWRQENVPVLLVYGAYDERVPPVESANAIQAALKIGGSGNVTLKMFANADHTFTIVDPPTKGGWPKHEPDYAAMLVNWVLALR